MRIAKSDAIASSVFEGLSCRCCAGPSRTRAFAAEGRAASGGQSGGSRAPASPRSIDVHHHISPRFYAEAIGPASMVNSYPASRIAAYEWVPELSLEMMDRGGIQTAITTINGGGRLTSNQTSFDLMRRCNEFQAKMVQDYPGRFGMFASLPMVNVDAALREVEYAFDTLKADGVYMMTSYQDKWLGDPSFAPVWDELNRRKALVYTHPTTPDFVKGLIPDVPDTVVEIGVDTSRAIASVVFGGTAGRCPDVKVIWSHGGGTLPFLIERFVRLGEREMFKPRLPHGFMHEINRFFYDVAQVAYPPPIAALTKLLPGSQIVFGTDYPFRTATEINAGLAMCGLSAATLRAIYRENVLKILPRFQKAAA